MPITRTDRTAMFTHPHRRIAGALMLLPLAAVAPRAAAQAGSPGLTLEEAVAASREQNPDMQAQRNDLVAADAAVRNARASFLPSASASAGMGYTGSGVQRFGSEVFGKRPDYYSSNYSVGVSYDLSGAKLMQPSIARAERQATAQRIEGYAADLTSRVVQQYLTALQAREQAEQAAREVDRTREHERLAQARLDVGAGTPLDLRRAQVQRGRAEAQHIQARNAHQTEILRLGQLMGRSLPVETELTSRFDLFAPSWSADSLARVALRENPTLQAYRARSGATQHQVRAARSQYLPTLSMDVGIRGSVYSAADIDPLVQQELASAQRGYEGCLEQKQLYDAVGVPLSCDRFNPADPAVQSAIRNRVESGNPDFPFGFERQPLSASLTLSIPLFDGLGRERRIEEARVAASDAQLQVLAQEQALATQVRAGVLSVQTAYETAELHKQVVANAAEELRLAQERFRFGAASSVEVTDAQTSLSEAERALIDAVYNYHKSLAALEALVGGQLR